MKYKLSIILLILALIAKAQEKPIKESNRPESEISAAINPVKPENIIVAAINDFEPGVGTNNSRLSIYYTMDFGATWQTSNFEGMTEVVGPFNFIGDPVVSFDHLGVSWMTHVAWVADAPKINTQIYVSQSTDGGQNWSSQLIAKSSDIAYDKPWINTDKSAISPYRGRVYAAYIEGKSSLGRADFDIILHQKSLTNSFSTTGVAVNTKDFNIVQSPNIFTNNLGQVFVSFIGNDGRSTALYLARSDDGGNTFLPEIKVADLRMYFNNFEVLGTIVNRQGLNRLYPCPQLAVDNSNGPFQNRIYLTWTDKEENPVHYGLDVFLAYSDDLGQTWSPPKVIHDHKAAFSHQYYSSIAIASSGAVLMSWYDRKNDAKNIITDYYFTHSKDGGLTFAGDRKLTSQPSDFAKIGLDNNNFGIGEYTQMVTSGNIAIPFWADGRRNNGNINIYQAKVVLDNTVSIEEQALKTSFRIVPNPTKDYIRLIGLEIGKPVSYWIADVNGKVMHNEKNKVLANTERINVSHLYPGVYFLKVFQEEAPQASFKFVIMK